jgi:hypothetical protein
VKKDYKLIYGQFMLKDVFDANGKKLNFPFFKQETNYSHSILDPVSFSDTKAAKYISSLIAKEIGEYSELLSDKEIGKNLDISYCSTGGFSNLKSIDIIESDNNRFYNFYSSPKEGFGIIDVESKDVIINDDENYDLGIIIKIKNKFFPKRTQICIAGMNIWGTSGAAWFLANKWKEIYKLVKNKQFGMIIKVKKGNDQESEIIRYKK